ncbi:hypothetical protein QZH41_011628 [Actinostola sp. cb2023]|nr:hypothetical protein QZH41_011628 [Actinostola sp. cb2023]
MFYLNPTAVVALRKERNQRSFEANSMIDKLVALRAILFERLLTTPFEISKRNDMIRRLKNDIYNIETNSDEQNRRIINEASKQEMADVKNSDGKKAKLQQEFIETKKRLEAEQAAHRANEFALRKRKYKIETEVENWIQKFDSDMGERQDEFDALDVVYTEEKKQLQELEERFKTLEKEYTTIVEERRIAKEKAEAAERELNMKIRAARLIQAMWRAHKARKLLQKKKKKGKKGKKGKKSGKGKKR